MFIICVIYVQSTYMLCYFMLCYGRLLCGVSECFQILVHICPCLHFCSGVFSMCLCVVVTGVCVCVCGQSECGIVSSHL